MSNIEEIIEFSLKLNEEKKDIYFRKMKWSPTGKTGIDIRQMYLKDDQLKNGKGIFLSENAAIDTAEKLVENGYGRTEVLKELLETRVNEVPLVTDDKEVNIKEGEFISLEEAMNLNEI